MSEAAVIVLEPMRRLEVADLGTSPKAVYNAALALGWEARAWLSVSQIAPVLYLTDSPEGASDPHRAGDVRFEGYVARNYAVEARDPDKRLGLRAHWTGRGTEGKSARFEDAFAVDPLGHPEVSNCDYTPGKDWAKALGITEEERLARGARLNAHYNDGEPWLNHRPYFTSSGAMNAWIDSWLERLAPDAKRLTTKRREKSNGEVEDATVAN